MGTVTEPSIAWSVPQVNPPGPCSFSNPVIVAPRRGTAEEMKFDFPLARILNSERFAGSGLKLLSKIGALANGRAGLTVLSSGVRAHGAVWSERAPASLAPENAQGNAMLTRQGGTGHPQRAALALTQELSRGFAGFGIPRL